MNKQQHFRPAEFPIHTFVWGFEGAVDISILQIKADLSLHVGNRVSQELRRFRRQFPPEQHPPKKEEILLELSCEQAAKALQNLCAALFKYGLITDK